MSDITTTTIYNKTYWGIQIMWQDFVLETFWEPQKGRRPQVDTKQRVSTQKESYAALFARLEASLPPPSSSMFFVLVRLIQDPRVPVNGNILMALERRGVVVYNERRAIWEPNFEEPEHEATEV